MQGCESSSFKPILALNCLYAKISAFSFIFSPYLGVLPQFYAVV